MIDEQVLEVKRLPDMFDVLAPDTSEIRLLLQLNNGSMIHCTLPPGAASLAGVHKTVEELWYCVQGQGQVWRKWGDHEREVDISSGVCITIPTQTHFQFRNSGNEPLCIIIVTMPPWPGEQEWVRVPDYWPC